MPTETLVMTARPLIGRYASPDQAQGRALLIIIIMGEGHGAEGRSRDGVSRGLCAGPIHRARSRAPNEPLQERASSSPESTKKYRREGKRVVARASDKALAFGFAETGNNPVRRRGR